MKNTENMFSFSFWRLETQVMVQKMVGNQIGILIFDHYLT
jgi:hypothetical protein